MVRLRRGSTDTDVSRGAQKLRPVRERVGFDCRGHVALDLGVGTGGFSQVLLEQGARRVFSVDVAYGTIALQLRNDPRVVLLERTNARELTRELVPEVITRVVGDLSFISWAAVLPAVILLTGADAELLLLIKPQFELAAAGRGAELRDGIVEDPEVARSCLENLYNTWCEHGLAPLAVVPAALRGAKGNQEYFVYLKRGEVTSLPDYEVLVKAALAEATG
jgi:23S rRNA (cytidine1920-2'-O)/16S rRNA (cytidine1409-2'-O)-methyltransferase